MKLISKNIYFKNFGLTKSNYSKKKIRIILNTLLKKRNEILKSLSSEYQDKFSKKLLNKYKKLRNIFIIGMGGSLLGSKAIFSYLNHKKKNISFIDFFFNNQNYKKKKLNLIISKSGNTLETLSNLNVIVKKQDNNIIITEDKSSHLMNIAMKLKSEIIHHNNFIGGRYSVLSEVGMLPAELMGYSAKKFRSLNEIVKNKNFINNLILNVSNIISQIRHKKTNSIIINYDERSEDLFKWYQQLVAESLGKNNFGVLPVISNSPRDNHSVMQYYLDGVKNHFFTFFFVKNNKTKKINNNINLLSYEKIRNKNLNDISYAQFLATQKIFKKKKIPFRTFEIQKRNEESLGELFIFFILETILIGKILKINPYNQPSVESIKKETFKIL
jgi:glucose-6-phosphate isomerase